MTSHVIHHNDPLRSAFGTHFELQVAALSAAEHMYETMVFSGRAKKFPKGGLIAIRGVLALFKFLLDAYNIQYLCLSYLNQCYLERFFGRIREMGGSDRNPSALHMLFRMKRTVATILTDVCYSCYS